VFRVDLESTQNEFSLMRVYEVRLRKDHRGVDLISNAFPFGRLWYEQTPDAIGYANFFQPVTCRDSRLG
jgi:hypothetical protein